MPTGALERQRRRVSVVSVELAVAGATDDIDTKHEGKADGTAGKVKEGVDRIKDEITGND